MKLEDLAPDALPGLQSTIEFHFDALRLHCAILEEESAFEDVLTDLDRLHADIAKAFEPPKPLRGTHGKDQDDAEDEEAKTGEGEGSARRVQGKVAAQRQSHRAKSDE